MRKLMKMITLTAHSGQRHGHEEQSGDRGETLRQHLPPAAAAAAAATDGETQRQTQESA